MARLPDAEPADDRLRQLLGVEQALQDRVRHAETAAARRIADARMDGERVRAQARDAQARLDEAQARADLAAHDAALAAVHTDHAAVMHAIAEVTPDRIDTLARRALDRAIGGDGGAR